MSQIASLAHGQAPTHTAASTPPRLAYIDHLRAALVILVVLHHVAVVYGANTPDFYYQEPPDDDPLAALVLSVVVLVNQAWFMGAFYLLAGYFTPGAYDRKGPGGFLTSRLIRLGIPLLVFIFVLNPLASIGYWLMPSSQSNPSVPLTWGAYPQLLGMGPMWFVVLLLIFNLGYVGWRWLMRHRAARPKSQTAFPGYLAIVIFILGLAAASFLLRFFIPVNKTLFQFPTLAYLPQYLSFFILGTVAFRQDWLNQMPSSVGAAGLVAALVTGVVLFPLAFSGHMFSMELSEAARNAFGNGHWESAVYTLWDSTFAVGLCLGLLVLFRRSFNGHSRLGSYLAQYGYTVYIIHIPILVFLAYTLRAISIGHLLKFGLVAAILVPLSFSAAYFVRKIPGADQVL